MITQCFDKSCVIEQSGDFKDIPEQTLVDFLPAIYRNELWILERWKSHLNSMGIPYAITRHIDKYKDRTIERLSLWKQRRV